MNIFSKDPGAVVDFTCDWADAHLEDEETIDSSSWRSTPADLALSGAVNTPGTATVTIEGGNAGCLYRLQNTVTTSLGRTEVYSIGIRVQLR